MNVLQQSTRHPCYDELAHEYFARMHVAVAPKCNISCKYCNIKYDCVSESRPGVVSRVLTPEEAYRKVQRTVAVLPRLTVVGIAGPGDPLANPQETFDTFALLAEGMPDLQLCLSTNGLMLADYADEIERYRINHVTVTMNTIDPAIGSQVYQAIFHKGKAYREQEAAAILIERQLAGIREIAARGIRVKVNSVLIPGVNDGHLAEVSRAVRDLGAFSHNIMPLIISPGSRYEREGRQAPDPELTVKVQEESAAIIPVMRHCRQCRADAVGLLGEDRGQDLYDTGNSEKLPVYSLGEREQLLKELDDELENRHRRRFANHGDAETGIRIAVATRGGGKVNMHFGHAKEFLIYEVHGRESKLLGIRKIQAYCNGTADCGEGADKGAILEDTIHLLRDCRILLCSGIGEYPQEKLRQADIMAITRKGGIQELLAECGRYYRYFRDSQIS
ncbi:nitrogenase cofactor biosynthesis protein NifB [Paenibacillus sabinae]|uniref:nitrogenase cofactor biosynthesis protein NifB n=1 Tax=Paenibacillus sabinae TaxID=365617 RepID=UPI00056DB8A5|nr:nitrogenase cofactor biosynthesis protein NifB [Paenibacillus sabinae]